MKDSTGNTASASTLVHSFCLKASLGWRSQVWHHSSSPHPQECRCQAGVALPLISTPTAVQEPSSHKGKFLELLVVNSYNYSVTSYIFKTVRIFSFKTICSYNFLLLRSWNLFHMFPYIVTLFSKIAAKENLISSTASDNINFQVGGICISTDLECLGRATKHFFSNTLLQIKHLQLFFFFHRSYLTNL